MTGWLIAFLLLAVTGMATIIAGIYLLAGFGWAVLAAGVAAMLASSVAYRAAFS